MKRFLIKTFLFIIPVFILIIPFEYFLQKIPNDYSYKNNYLNDNSENIQILILGASYSYNGINPEYFDYNTFNASHVSQTYDYCFKIFNKYQENFNNLDIVIFPVSYLSFYSKLSVGNEIWREKNYKIYYGLDIDNKKISNYFEILNNKLRYNLDRIINYFLKNEHDNICTPLGFIPLPFNEADTKNLEESGRNAAIRHTRDIDSKFYSNIYLENIAGFNEFINNSKNNNITVLLINIPAHYSYREHLDIKQLSKMHEAINHIVENNNNAIFLDWYDNDEFLDSDFADADHLNEIGAKKLSIMLSDYINSLNIIKKGNT